MRLAQLLIIVPALVSGTAAYACPSSVLTMDFSGPLPECVELTTPCLHSDCRTGSRGNYLLDSGAFGVRNNCVGSMELAARDCPHCPWDELSIEGTGVQSRITLDERWSNSRIGPDEEPTDIALVWKHKDQEGQLAITLIPDVNICGNQDEGGCSTAPETPGWPWMLAVFLGGLAWRRRN